MTEHDYHRLAPQDMARHLAEHHPGVVAMPYVAAAAYILSHKIDVDADVWNRARRRGPIVTWRLRRCRELG